MSPGSPSGAGYGRTSARSINGVIFSDLGLASKFMGLAWVQRALSGCLGFAPFPATLNVHPATKDDAATWQSIRDDVRFYSHMPTHEGSCVARIYRIKVQGQRNATDAVLAAAVLVPELKNYPPDKIEIVAPVRLKDTFGLKDGDQLTLEFIH
jgi:riboflavin kinase